MQSHAPALASMFPNVEINPSSPGAGTVNGAGVDMAGSDAQGAGLWDGVVFALIVGVIGNGGTVDARVQASANSNYSGAINITGGLAITQLPNGVANVVCHLDCYRPTNRYVRLVVTVGTNNANIAAASYRYRGQSRLPTKQQANFQYATVVEN